MDPVLEALDVPPKSSDHIYLTVLLIESEYNPFVMYLAILVSYDGLLVFAMVKAFGKCIS